MSGQNKASLMGAIRILLSVLVICVSLLFLTELYNLKVLSGLWFVIGAMIVLLIDALAIFCLNHFTRRQASRTACSVLAVALAVVFGAGSWYISRANTTLGRLTRASEQVKNTIDVYAMADSDLSDVSSLNGKTIGILETINTSGTEKLLDDLSDQGITVITESYSNFGPLANALYTDEVDAIVVNEIYLSNITDLEAFPNFLNETKIVYQYVYYTDIEYSTAAVNDITKEPFTVMLNGSDSRGGLGDTDRSDVNMLVTINPQTKVVLMVSIPRDSYVETVCDAEYGCLQGQYDKLTHTGIHTYHTTQKTIENFMDVDINYVFRANFSAVIDIVDALGGIDVYVEPGYAVDYFYTNDLFGTSYGVTEGWNHLNGEAALCYARERYAYTEGDFQRIKNQQQVLTAIAQAVTKPDVIIKYNSLLSAIDGNFWTDLSTDEIMEFIQFQISKNPDWTFISYALSGTSDSLYCAESYNYASVVILDQNTVKLGRELIEAVLEGKSADEINEMIDDSSDMAPDYSLDSSSTVDVDTSSSDYYAPVQDNYDYSYSYSQDVIDYNTYTPDYDTTYQEPVYTAPDTSYDYNYSYSDNTYTDPGYDSSQTTTVAPDYSYDYGADTSYDYNYSYSTDSGYSQDYSGYASDSPAVPAQ